MPYNLICIPDNKIGTFLSNRGCTIMTPCVDVYEQVNEFTCIGM